MEKIVTSNFTSTERFESDELFVEPPTIFGDFDAGPFSAVFITDFVVTVVGLRPDSPSTCSLAPGVLRGFPPNKLLTTKADPSF